MRAYWRVNGCGDCGLMTLRSTPEDVLACIADRGIDEDGIFAAEWLKMIERHDLPALIILICKRRKEPSYKPLIEFLTACIEAEQADI